LAAAPCLEQYEAAFRDNAIDEKLLAKSWKYWADEIRDIRDTIEGEEPRRILAEIAANFDRLHDWTLKQSGPSERHQAIDVLMSRPFSVAKRNREPKK
jgi:hypothetical protein